MTPPAKILILLAILLSTSPLTAKRIKLTNRIETPRQSHTTLRLDSAAISEARSLINFAGYEKKATSAVETMFVTNLSPYHITTLNVTITYTDLTGRMLHVRNEQITTDIPAGETRMISIPSFDRQKSLYYHKSTPPRKGGMPFEVEIYLNSIEIPE